MRAFLGIGLGDGERAALEAALKKQPAWPGGRKVAARNWHVTLAFLDHVGAEAKPRLEAALANTELGAPFALKTGAFGAFPTTTEARVAWLGFHEGVDRLRELQRHVANAVGAAGLPAAESADEFVPHLTLARLDPPANVSRAVGGAPPPAVVIPVTRVVLFSSTPGAAGSEYTEVGSWDLR